MREKLGHAIWAAWMEGSVLVLLLVLDQPKHFAGRRLIEPYRGIAGAYRLEHVQRADTGDLRREHRLLPRRRDEALRGKVINLVDRRALHDALDRRQVAKIAVDQLHLIGDTKLAQPPQRIGAAPRTQATHVVAPPKQKSRQIRTVLPGDTCDERGLSHQSVFSNVFSQYCSAAASDSSIGVCDCQPVCSRIFRASPTIRDCSNCLTRAASCSTVIATPDSAMSRSSSSLTLVSRPEQTL